MEQGRIVLAGACPKLAGLRWESDRPLRIGRQASADVPLDDPSVGSEHAEVFPSGSRWLVRDLADSDQHPTFLNGVRLGRGTYRLQCDDRVQCGELTFTVAEIAAAPPAAAAPRPPAGPRHIDPIRTSGNFIRVQAASQNTWDEALQAAAGPAVSGPRRDRHLLTLLRTGQHLSHLASLDDLLRSVLTDAIAAVGAQRGSIFLLDPAAGGMRLRSFLAPRLPASSARWASKTLAERCFRMGESILCRDVSAEADLAMAPSVQRGAMSSLICALLRSPRKRLGVLQLDRGPLHDPFEQDDFYLADAVAASVAVGIESALLVEEQREQFLQTVTTLARTVEVRDQYTGSHTRRVTDYSLLLGDQLAVTAAERDHLQVGTPLHDIGKIGIGDSILRKPGRLTAAEFEVMKQHPVMGAAILGSIASLGPVVPIVRHHHERWDGSGYPDGLAGEAITRTARIVAVADAFDAMTSDRPYRPAMPSDKAFAELHAGAGTHFDPECVRAFLRARAGIEELLGRE